MGVPENESTVISFGKESVTFSVVDVNPADDGNKRSSRHKSKKNFKRSQHHFMPRERRRSLPGRKPARRRENFQFLLSLCEGLELDENGEVDPFDLLDDKQSCFYNLFMEEEKMAAWNAFVNSPEDEQTELLNSISSPRTCRSESSFTSVIENSMEQSHYAFSKISYKLRHFLNRKHIPKGDLVKIEEELVDFFVEWPDSVYITCLPDSFHRMLVHAVSQYLDLDARSFDCTQGKRRTQVESKKEPFSPPAMSLVEYLDHVKS